VLERRVLRERRVGRVLRERVLARGGDGVRIEPQPRDVRDAVQRLQSVDHDGHVRFPPDVHDERRKLRVHVQLRGALHGDRQHLHELDDDRDVLHRHAELPLRVVDLDVQRGDPELLERHLLGVLRLGLHRDDGPADVER
jgi:hypothetical protein